MDRLKFGLLTILAVFTLSFATPGLAQDNGTDAREATGGAQTLEDILRRQRGEEVDNAFRSTATGDPNRAAATTDQLGTLGGSSDPELWRALRFGSADITTTAGNPGANLLVQDSGMAWLQFRQGPLRVYGGYFLLGVLAVVALFFLLRGRIRIDGGRSGVTIERFKAVERFGHWLLAGSFILLAITGLWSLFGRKNLIPLIGQDAYATTALWAKWVHDNVAWAFMLGVVMVFVMWVFHNIPNRHDLVWLAKGGGLFSKNSHPPARKFNAGQKIIFWGVIVLGVSISLSGLSMLFPFELPMFAKTFVALNSTGLPEALGFGVLPETLTPHAEMQLAQAWHGIVAFAFIGLIIGHIYLGSLGMEGAYDAMGSGDVDLQWAKEHHGLWVEELEAQSKETPSGSGATPAE